jgi:hypothetical protein
LESGSAFSKAAALGKPEALEEVATGAAAFSKAGGSGGHDAFSKAGATGAAFAKDELDDPAPSSVWSAQLLELDHQPPLQSQLF